MNWVDVKDSDARPGTAVAAYYSTDSGNNSNWIFAAAGQTNTWTGASSTVWGNGANWSLGRAPQPLDDKLVIPASCPRYPVLDAPREVNKLDVASGAALNLNGYNFTVDGNANWAGTLTASGSERVTFYGGTVDFSGSTVTAMTSTVIFGGAGAQTINLAGRPFWTVSVTNTAGLVTLNGGGTASELQLDGGGAAMSVAFQPGATLTLTGLVVMGSSATTNITLRSTTPGSPWNVAASYARVSGADVQDSAAGGVKAIYGLNSKDSGNNSNWIFGTPCGIWLGTVSSIFTNAASWSPPVVPGAGTVILVETNNLTISTTQTVKGVVLTGTGTMRVNSAFTVAGDVTVRGTTLTDDQPMTVSNDIVIVRGGLLTHTANGSTEQYKVNVTVGGNLTVDVGSSIDATRRGYGDGQGPATAQGVNNQSAASHGGQGSYNSGNSPSLPYGSIVTPTNIGCGGVSIGSGDHTLAYGGGAVILNVAGTTALNGLLLANGGPRDGNCTAAGGSIYLTTSRLTGSGTINARGGTATAARPGGGGGRIAIVLTNGTASYTDFTGSISACGLGSSAGGPGTVYLRAPGQALNAGTLIVDNGGVTTTVGALIAAGVGGTSVGDVLLRNSGRLALDLNQTLTVGGVWSNGAAFSATTGASVVFAGSGVSTSAVYGNSTFRRLTCATPGKTIKFAVASSNAVMEALVLTGVAGTNVVLRSTSDGSPWKLNVSPSAIQTIDRLDVKDSDALSGALVTAPNSVDSGNNTNWSFPAGSVMNTWTGTVDTSWGNGANWSLGRIPALIDDTIVIPAGCSRYPSLDIMREINALTLAAGASLNLNGCDFIVNRDATVAGTLTATGAERFTFKGGTLDFTGGTVTPATSTLLLGGGGAQTANVSGKVFYNLLVTNITGTVTLMGGCTASELRGVSGGPLSLAFQTGVVFSIQDFVMPGAASATNITLRSTVSGSPWRLNMTRYAQVTGVDVKDSDASGGKTIYPLSSKDSGNNSNWGFSATWGTWLGTNSTSFTNAANWSPAVVPTASALILVSGTNPLTISSTTTVKGVVLGGGAGAALMRVNAPFTIAGDVLVSSNGTLVINQPMTVSNAVAVQTGGTLTHDKNGTAELYRLTLQVLGDLAVYAGGAIDVTQKGWAGDNGPGVANNNVWGASHGGQGTKNGGTAGAPTYGSLSAPTNSGSGGAFEAGAGSTGGGAIILSVAGTTTVNGQCVANGGARDGNCTAAGGSIYLTTGRLTGSGALNAQGGTANARGGGGGRIAVVLTNTAASFGEFTGSMLANGLGGGAGGAGTIYLRTPGQAFDAGALIVDGGGTATAAGALIWSNTTERTMGAVVIRNGGVLALDVNQSMTVVGLWSNNATLSAATGGNVVFGGNSGSTALVYGVTTFGRLTCTTPGKTLRFASGSSNTVQEALTLAGAGSSNVVLRSLTDGAAWKLNLNAAAVQAVSRVDVKDSDARSGTAVTALNSVDSGNNSNWVFAASGQTDTWTGASSTGWGNSANWSLGRAPQPSDDKVVIPSPCPNYPALDVVREINQLDLASGAALNLNGFDFIVQGNATLAGRLKAAGSERLTFNGSVVDFSGSTVTAATSTVIFGGAGAQTVTLAGQPFWYLLVTNVAGTVTLNGGCQAAELRLDGGTAPMDMVFQAGASFSVSGLVVKGTSSTNIVLRSATPGNRWKLAARYARVTGATVQDGDASADKAIYALNSKDSGNNTNWVFGTPFGIWVGTNSASFTNAANWSPAVVPGTDAVILAETTNLLQIGSAVTLKGVILRDASQMQVRAPFTVADGVTVWSATLCDDQPMTVSNDVMVVVGGLLTHTANGATEQYKVDLTVGGNLIVDAASAIDITCKGYACSALVYTPGYGPGEAGFSGWDTCGASYGGQGAKNAGYAGAPTYGSVCAPTNLGSAGQNSAYPSAGGGSALLRVAGTTTLGGPLLANGGPRDGNCTAAGGSIYLVTGRLLGQGAIKANGGTSNVGRGGGGGRIAVLLRQAGATFADFTGPISASGLGAYAGGAGTVYLEGPGQAGGSGDVIIDNAHQGGAGVTLLPASLMSVSNELQRARLIITNGTTSVLLTSESWVTDLYVYPGAILALSNFDLHVHTPQHALGGGVTNSTGGQILWRSSRGSVYTMR